MKKPVLEFSSQTDTYTPLTIRSERASIETHYYPTKEKGRALVAVGGVGGGFDSPAHHLYPTLGEELCTEGIAALRVQYRYPTDLDSSVQDVLLGIEALTILGHSRVALVGHSLGGAVVISAAVLRPEVVSIIALATQSYGAIHAAKKLQKQHLLLIHGLNDEILPSVCSEEVYRVTQSPKKLYLLPETGHMLDEAAEEVKSLCVNWIKSTL